MSEFQKIKVSTDQNAIDLQVAKYEGKIEFYQNTLNLIKDIKPDFVFASNDLKFLFDNPRAYLVDRIITEPTTIGGIELDKEKVFEILQDADRLKAIVNYVEKLKRNVRVEMGVPYNTPLGQFNETNYIHENERNLHAYTSDFEITADNEVILKETTIQKIEISNSIFLTTQKQKDYYDSIKIIEGELKKMKVYRITEKKFLEENFTFNYHGELLGINYKNLLREI